MRNLLEKKVERIFWLLIGSTILSTIFSGIVLTMLTKIIKLTERN